MDIIELTNTAIYDILETMKKYKSSLNPIPDTEIGLRQYIKCYVRDHLNENKISICSSKAELAHVLLMSLSAIDGVSKEEYVDKYREMLLKKNTSYSANAFINFNLFSDMTHTSALRVRIDTKILRIITNQRYGDENDLADLFGYLIIELASIMIRKELEEFNKKHISEYIEKFLP